MEKKIVKKRAHVDEKYCVACGVCAKNCPLSIIEIKNGIFAKINPNKCIGCGKCANACPASVVKIY